MSNFQNGDLCISILHPPVDDPQSGELPCERWNPTQSVRTVLLSVISLLNEPNTFSPANVDASVMYRRWRDSKGKDKEYENIIRWEFYEWTIFFPFHPVSCRMSSTSQIGGNLTTQRFINKFSRKVVIKVKCKR